MSRHSVLATADEDEPFTPTAWLRLITSINYFEIVAGPLARRTTADYVFAPEIGMPSPQAERGRLRGKD